MSESRALIAEPASPVASRFSRWWFRAAPRVLPLVPFAALLLIWAACYWIFKPSLATLPSIADVIDSFIEMGKSGELWADIAASSWRWVLGFVVGVVSGVVLGVAAGLNGFLARTLEPLATFFTAVSGIAWIPLAIVWFGIGTTTVVFIIWNSVFFLVFSNTLLGVRLSPPVLEDAARTLGAGRWHIITRVVFPGAMTYIMAGIRAGAGFGWRALIAAEIIGATTGLGALIYQAQEYYRTDQIIAGIIVIAILGVLIDTQFLARIERRTIERWGMVNTGRGEG
jgi:taurine transport system permease protein